MEKKSETPEVVESAIDRLLESEWVTKRCEEWRKAGLSYAKILGYLTAIAKAGLHGVS